MPDFQLLFSLEVVAVTFHSTGPEKHTSKQNCHVEFIHSDLFPYSLHASEAKRFIPKVQGHCQRRVFSSGVYVRVYLYLAGRGDILISSLSIKQQ